MSNYKAIAAISTTLQSLLWAEFQNDRDIDMLTQEAIVFKSPNEAAKDSTSRLSLWLYDITENEFVSNQPMLRMGTVERVVPSLALNLHYMITPFAQTEHGNLLMLAKVMEVMHENNLHFQDQTTPEITEELRIILSHESLEDMSRIWQTLREPYRLSVCYQIKTVLIEAQELLRRTPMVQGISSDP